MITQQTSVCACIYQLGKMQAKMSELLLIPQYRPVSSEVDQADDRCLLALCNQWLR